MIEKQHIIYLISSTKGYETPLARLLESMVVIDHRRIFVVSGGHSDYRVHVENLICHIDVTHNSYDYTALIEAIEQHPYGILAPTAFTHIFLLHDTMELSFDSDRLIRDANPALDAVAVWGGECNLGLYRVDYLRSRRDAILALKNCTKLQAVEAEGFLWRTCPEERRGSYPGPAHLEPTRAIYGGATRQGVVYEGVGITKWKANWGQDWPPNVVTP